MIKTRFAPSPTGFLHIGGLRTALYSYLWARRNKGEFYLRVEDTDLSRNSQEATEAILKAFEWCGLSHDGDVTYQSKRFDLYKNYIEKLLDEKKAYYCYMSKEELDTLREEQRAAKQRPRYDGRYRDFSGTPPSGIKPVVRIKAPLEGEIVVSDGIKGEVRFSASEYDDFIIARSDGTPTYNFVVAIDDALMGITDVIRGDDHLSNTPKQMIIYEALGFEVPRFYHIPMILNPDGKKLSKRDGATDVMEYKKMGFLPEALLNFLVRLGWSHGDDEIFSMDELLELFNPNDINASASAYNQEKLLWLNAHYIKNSPNERLKEELKEFDIYLSKNDREEIILDTLKDRAKTIDELSFLIKEILETPQEYDNEKIEKLGRESSIEILQGFLKELEKIDDSSHLPPEFDALAKEYMEANSIKMKFFGMPLRTALIGKAQGAAVGEIMSILGKEESIKRVEKFLEQF
ncbi:MAG: glutamate--tRNA ligase [Campylobacterales bacterium]